MRYDEVLQAAAVVIDKHGWHRHLYHGQITDPKNSSRWTPGGEQTGPHCLVGAMIRAIADSEGRRCDEQELGLRYAEHHTGRLLEINMYRIKDAVGASDFLRARAAAVLGSGSTSS